ncbi:M3 family metallopeptidase [Candidatus Nomurabacteria bacterium]|nr:M3 family metallopeptidase [Candidatus Nomurabacteria bacterium]
MENPLLKYKNDTNDSYIRFDLIKDEHFEPAFEVALATAKENLQKIIDNPDTPTFENTVEAMEYISEDLDRVSTIFFDLKESNTNKTLDSLAQKISPILAEYANDISFNQKLFEKVKYVFDSKPNLETKEQYRLLKKTYKSFVRNGALLSEEDKQLVRNYDKEIVSLRQSFSENLLAANNFYILNIKNEEDLSGLPERIKNIAKEEAIEKNKEGWVFTLKYTSMAPFMKYSDKEQLRKEMWLESNTEGMKEPFDNREIIIKISKLRKKLANVLGYKSHAHFVLEDRMAKTPENVQKFFSALYETSRPLAEKDFETLRSYKEKLTGEKELFPWDIAYYSEKISKENFDFDEELIRPYLSMDLVIKGIFEHARLLYGLNFSERKDIPIYHDDVKVFEVKKETGDFMGLLYLDLFPRDSKRNGAWADMIKGQYKINNINIRPNVVIVASLTKPTADSPSLLTSYEASTIFHEFGHALHVLLSDCQYASLSGYNATWDFVELPSQLMESWLHKKEGFNVFAKHYQTSEPLPDNLLEASLKSDRFLSAWRMLGQLGASVLDMAWHNENVESISNLEEFETNIKKPFNLFNKHYKGTSQSTSFAHVFSAGAGYSAGYYSYHWAEVLAADAFEYFKEKGLFSREVADKFKENILSKGNTEEPLELYRTFRGRDADPKALFRHKGLIK